MGSLKLLTLAGAFSAAAATAQAADLLPPPPPPMYAPAPVLDVGGGWYLRGDVGVGILDLRGTNAIDVSTPPVPYVYNKLQDEVSDQVFVGLGVGYQWNGWLRGDVTGEYRTQTDWKFVAEDTTFGAVGGFNSTTGKFSSIVGLANVYVDLGTWNGFTPFVGAGAGFAHHRFASVTDKGLGTYSTGFGYGGEKDQTNFAWALHAGLGYAVNPNLKLELAYRYLNMGDIETGVVGCLPSCPGNLKTVYKLKDVESHDIKIGMRWLLGAPAPVLASAPVMEQPLVRKY